MLPALAMDLHCSLFLRQHAFDSAFHEFPDINQNSCLTQAVRLCETYAFVLDDKHRLMLHLLILLQLAH